MGSGQDAKEPVKPQSKTLLVERQISIYLFSCIRPKFTLKLPKIRVFSWLRSVSL